MLLGFMMGVLSSGLMWLAASMVSTPANSPQGTIVPDAQKISVAWPALAYITLTLAEVLVYGTGLELSYTAAPKNMKGFVTACFLATIMAADLINARVSQLYGGSLADPLADRGRLSTAGFFALMTFIALGAMVGFYFVARRLKRQSAAEAFWNKGGSMKYVLKRVLLGSISAVLLSAAAPAAFADEGMWLFNRPPRKELQEKYGFEPTPEWLDHVQKSSVRFNSGGSGSFVSADGLVMTNHHVGADSLQKIGDAKHNYLRDGFYAKTHADEIQVSRPGIERPR